MDQRNSYDSRRGGSHRIAAVAVLFLAFWGSAASLDAEEKRWENVDEALDRALRKVGFTGKFGSSIEQRLGRPLDQKKAALGQSLFFDKFLGLHGYNSCAGCHSPLAGFGDTQSIAIGVDNNDIVGPGRKGARKQRRAPSVINNAFFPKLMLNGRFAAISGDPFDNSKGFEFPSPEGRAQLFPPNDPNVQHLLVAQTHIPATEPPEMAGFTKVTETSFAARASKRGARALAPSC
jgi:cytochrome c peroxidase